jgi:hypothetical protein
MKKEDITTKDIRWLLNWAVKDWRHTSLFVFIIFLTMACSLVWILKDEIKAKVTQYMITPEIAFSSIDEISNDLMASVGADAIVIAVTQLQRDKKQVIHINRSGKIINSDQGSSSTLFSYQEEINNMIIKLIRGNRFCENYDPMISIITIPESGEESRGASTICYSAIPAGYSGYFLGILAVVFSSPPANQDYILNEMDIYSNKLTGRN